MIRITAVYRPIYKTFIASGLADPARALAREWWLARLEAKRNLNFGRSEVTLTVICLLTLITMTM